jgi:hypothetical protein
LAESVEGELWRLDLIGRTVTGVQCDHQSRIDAIVQCYESGQHTKAELSRIWGVEWKTIDKLLRDARRKEGVTE